MFHIGFNLIIIFLDFLLHVILTVGSNEVGYNRNRFVGFRFGFNFSIVDNYLCVKNFLYDLLPNVP